MPIDVQAKRLSELWNRPGWPTPTWRVEYYDKDLVLDTETNFMVERASWYVTIESTELVRIRWWRPSDNGQRHFWKAFRGDSIEEALGVAIDWCEQLRAVAA